MLHERIKKAKLGENFIYTYKVSFGEPPPSLPGTCSLAMIQQDTEAPYHVVIAPPIMADLVEGILNEWANTSYGFLIKAERDYYVVIPMKALTRAKLPEVDLIVSILPKLAPMEEWLVSRNTEGVLCYRFVVGRPCKIRLTPEQARCMYTIFEDCPCTDDT